MEATSHQKYLRVSPKKIKFLTRLTTGLKVNLAVSRLEFMPGDAPKLLVQAIKSAQANAVNNLKLNSANLIVKEVITNKGPFFKRWQPISRGMAHSIKKRTTHITVKVGERKEAEKLIKAPDKEEIKKEKK